MLLASTHPVETRGVRATIFHENLFLQLAALVVALLCHICSLSAAVSTKPDPATPTAILTTLCLMVGRVCLHDWKDKHSAHEVGVSVWIVAFLLPVLVGTFGRAAGLADIDKVRPEIDGGTWWGSAVLLLISIMGGLLHMSMGPEPSHTWLLVLVSYGGMAVLWAVEIAHKEAYTQPLAGLSATSAIFAVGLAIGLALGSITMHNTVAARLAQDGENERLTGEKERLEYDRQFARRELGAMQARLDGATRAMSTGAFALPADTAAHAATNASPAAETHTAIQTIAAVGHALRQKLARRQHATSWHELQQVGGLTASEAALQAEAAKLVQWHNRQAQLDEGFQVSDDPSEHETASTHSGSNGAGNRWWWMLRP